MDERDHQKREKAKEKKAVANKAKQTKEKINTTFHSNKNHAVTPAITDETEALPSPHMYPRATGKEVAVTAM